MSLSQQQLDELHTHLQQAVIACTERCLYFAAKWSAELLNALEAANRRDDAGSDTDVEDENDIPAPPITRNPDPREANLEAKEFSRYLMAKSFFDCREYDRCAAVFLPTPSPHSAPPQPVPISSQIGNSPLAKSKLSSFRQPASKPKIAPLPKNISQKALFLALYARYLSGEKRKNEDAETILGPADGPSLANKEVPGLVAILEEYFASHEAGKKPTSQGWLDYLFGLVLLKSKSEMQARQWLLRSININPWNWSAWLDLGSVAGSLEELQQIQAHLPQSVMTFFFHIHCSQELFQQSDTAFQALTHMEKVFPTSAFLLQQKAMMHYHARDHDTAMRLFDDLLKNHPSRLDGLEVYSNLLYVLPHRPKLAKLATLASNTDKFRPETNCILGNYYSLIAEHEKAVLHFRRALSLDRNFQAAWTLMGHEYIELKNTQAAIESYRRAVDINRKDYRAWYGLGQGYEMLECYSYSLFYYQRAAALCPADPKMWAAVGNAYSKCNKTVNAIQAYKRALIVGSQMEVASSFGSGNSDPLAHAVGGALDPQILYDIALLFERDGNWQEAAAYMELTLAQEEGVEQGEEGLGVTQITSRARLWLAKYSYTNGDWQRTMELANELCQDGVEVEEAKSLVKDVRARLAIAEQEEKSMLSTT